jgi:hypothetical protein
MNLLALRNLLTSYVGRTDPEFLTHRDNFVRAGHRYVERHWLGREQYFRVWGKQVLLQAGEGSMSLPPEYRPSAQLDLHLAPPEDPEHMGTDLERVPIDAMMRAEPWRLADGTMINLYDRVTRGEPRAFAVFSRILALRPINATPKIVWLSGAGWTYELVYDTDETVVTKTAPYAVLYAAIREAWAFLGDPVQKATWEAEAARAIEAWIRDATQEEVAAHGLPLVMQVPG